MKIVVFGLGYVGLANALLLATKNQVVGIDINTARMKMLRARKSPLKDAEIVESLETSTAKFTATLTTKVAREAELFLIATPTNYDDRTGKFDTSSIESVIAQILQFNNSAPILIKSTIPVGYVEKARARFAAPQIIFSPEFLREGHALYDCLNPSRVVIGENSERGQKIAQLFTAAAHNQPTVILTDPTEAEAIKLFSNTYLAMRVAFFNELDSYAMLRNLNSAQIIAGVSADPRCGNFYNNPSFGYGGYCLPKDTKQLLADFRGVPSVMMQAIVDSNSVRKQTIAKKVLDLKPKTVGVYRLAMKSDSDNFRESAIFGVLKILDAHDVRITIYEPMAREESINGWAIKADLKEFKKSADIILANRFHTEIDDARAKVFTRDLFNEN